MLGTLAIKCNSCRLSIKNKYFPMGNTHIRHVNVVYNLKAFRSRVEKFD